MDVSDYESDSDLFKTQTSISNIGEYISEGNLNKFFKFEDDNAINLIHINARSLKKNIEQIRSLINNISSTITAIAISETWLTDNLQDVFFLNGYNFISKNRNGKLGGGVGIFVCSSLNYIVRNDLCRMSDFIECIFIEIVRSDKKNIIIGSVYRPPSKDRNCVDMFNSDFNNILMAIEKGKSKTVLIAGDYNLDLLKCNQHGPTDDFLKNLISYAYVPAIKHPTRIAEYSATLIDNIFINSSLKKFDSAIVYSDISDHLPIAIHLSSSIDSGKKPKTCQTRCYNKKCLENFNNTLNADLRWIEVNSLSSVKNDPNAAYDLFYAIYEEHFNKCFPLKTIKLNTKYVPQNEWMTRGLLRSCNKRSMLFKKFKNGGTEHDKKTYIKYRNKLKSILKKTQKSFYQDKFTSLAGNLRQTWKLLGKITKNESVKNTIDSFSINGVKIEDKNEISDKLNEYFVNIGRNLAAQVPASSTDFSQYMKNKCSNSIYLFSTDAKEVVNIVLSLKNKNSFGIDRIPVKIMIASIYPVAEPIANIINSSLQTGIFPDKLKIAKICPVFKCGERNCLANYRPISVLPSFSKIFEKVIFNRIVHYINSKRILTDSQYGFRQKHSTFMAIIDMCDKVTEALEKNEYSVGIFIDLSKAFDTLNHDILLRKLEHYGIRGIALQWFYSYLSNRKQYVAVNEISSSMRYITCGVPQGSILGPLLFILYINDIVHVSQILRFILFADDTNLFYSDKSLDNLQNVLNTELSKLVEWFRANKLSLNAQKTNYIFFGYKKIPRNQNLKLSLDGNSISQVESTKFLGVYLDEKLTWKNHIDHISLKISRGLSIMSRVRNILPLHVILMLYHTMIYPYLTYCNIVWGSAKCSVISKVQVLQKRAIRLCTGSEFRASTSPLFKRLHLLKVTDINNLQTAIFMFKIKFGLLPASCMHYVIINDINNVHYTRKKSFFKLMKFRTNLRELSISIRGPKLWNMLPEVIQNACSVCVFKKTLTIHYINLY